MTSDHCRVTVQRLFSKNFLIAWNVQKRYLTVARRSRDHRLLSPDRSATFFKIFPNCFKRPKNVVWQSVDVRVTSVHCRVTPVTFFRVCFVRLLHTLAYVVFLVIFEGICSIEKLYNIFIPTDARQASVIAGRFNRYFEFESLFRISNLQYQPRGLRPLGWYCICNINLAAYGRSVDIANSRKILFNVYFEIIQ